MRWNLASAFPSFAVLAVASATLTGCTFGLDDVASEVGDDVSCNLSVGLANGRTMDEGGVVYGAVFAPIPDVLARGTVEDLRFAVPTRSDTENTILEPTLAVEGDALAAAEQSLSCATSEQAILEGRIEARDVGTGKIVVKAIDGVHDTVSFEVREAASLGVTGPEDAAPGDQLYIAADLRDASDLPLYASSSVTWTVLEGDVTLPEADDEGALHGAYALVVMGQSERAVVQAEALGFTATIAIEASGAE